MSILDESAVSWLHATYASARVFASAPWVAEAWERVLDANMEQLDEAQLAARMHRAITAAGPTADITEFDTRLMELKRQPDVWRYLTDVWLPCAVERLSDAQAAVFLAVYVLLRFALERVAPSDLATEHRLHALRLRVKKGYAALQANAMPLLAMRSKHASKHAHSVAY